MNNYKIILSFVLLFSLNAYCENLILTQKRAEDLYFNLALTNEYGTKSFVSSDNLIKLECSISLYQPVCDLTIVPTADQKSWSEFMTILSGPNVSRTDGVSLKTNHLEMKCHDVCDIKLIF